MKKALIILTLLVGVFVVQGCSSGPEPEAQTTSPEASSQYDTASEGESSTGAPAATGAAEAEAGE